MASCFCCHGDFFFADELHELEFQPWCSLRFGLEVGRNKLRLARDHFATFSFHNTVGAICCWYNYNNDYIATDLTCIKTVIPIVEQHISSCHKY